jgi:hypothetical protein
MLEFINAARASLAAINPDLPAALFVVLVFLTVLAIRKLFPGAWEKWAAVVPVLAIDPSPVLVLLSKLWQAVPAAVIGAVLAALQSGADVKATVYGALLALVAPVAHELAKNYRGSLGVGTGPLSRRAPPLSMLMLVVLLGFVPTGCAGWKPVARTVDGVAETLCAQFFGEKQKLSLEDAAKQFCATHEELQPWIDQVLAAKREGGKAALARTVK